MSALTTWVERLDEWLATEITSEPEPMLDRWMPRVSRAADHLVVWWATAAVLSIPPDRSLRRAARRGLAAMLVAGPVCNLVGKQAVGRPRPPLWVRRRRPGRVPDSGAFPSGHAAAAAAFATGVGVNAPLPFGALVGGLAAVVCYSRVYTGAHFPGDVVAGAGAGAGTALLLHRLHTRHGSFTRSPGGPAPAEPADGEQGRPGTQAG